MQSLQSSPYVPGRPEILVGPVIGTVTANTARILLEFAEEATIIAYLTHSFHGVEEKHYTTQMKTQVKARRPTIFTFYGLKEDTKYTFNLMDYSKMEMGTESYFTTLSHNLGLRFAVVSCNDRLVQMTKDSNTDLWADLLKRVKNKEIQYLIHGGDQVYMDSPFSLKEKPEYISKKPYYQIMQKLTGCSREYWLQKKEEMLEILRSEYRNTWMIKNVRETLAKIPNLMTLDDHEIRDDWGYLPEDNDPNSLDNFYGTLARQVYYEYQRQLREDIPDFYMPFLNNILNIKSIKSEYYAIILNGVGFVFLDYRGTRTWHKDGHGKEESPLGDRQMGFLRSMLTEDEDFAKLNHLFIVSPLTFVFLNQKILKGGVRFNNDARENWAFSDTGKKEQIMVLEWLRIWKRAKPNPKRIATILGGDIHMAGHAHIRYNKEFIFHQFVTSSIASSSPGFFTFNGYKVAKEFESLSGPWTTDHGDWTNKFNYGVVQAYYNENGPAVSCREVVANKYDIEMKKGNSVSYK